MLGTLGLFGGLFTAWWLLLWWVLPVSWQTMSPSVLLSLHLAPPILLGVVWRVWQKIRASKLSDMLQAKQDAAEAERVALREGARQQHLADLVERQHAVLCHGIWGNAVAVKQEPAWLNELPEGAYWQALLVDDIDADDDAATQLERAIEQVLSDVYASAPGAAWLPHYFEAHTDKDGREQLAMLKSVQQRAAGAQYFEEAPASVDARFLPGTGALMVRVQQLLQQNVSVPGVLILAADTPLLQRGMVDEWDEIDPEHERLNAWLGMPSQAAVAMVFMRAHLPEPKEAVVREHNDDVYTPYWEKQQQYSDEAWGRVPTAQQASLFELPVLAQLQVPVMATAQYPNQQAFAREMHSVFENALLNAAMRDYPFSEEDRDCSKDQAESIAWLVHNSGDVDVGGGRLAAISVALSQQQVPLNPIDEASNTVCEWGDVGHASNVLQTAMAVMHCARLAAPVVLAQFFGVSEVGSNEAQSISLALVRPQEQNA
ncbi:hypothetical protein [Deefgea rivuli]|uniref:hypothetical protein n=1 Tax=Deefgea rivuli TaxID=400948 RepID=UPI00068464EC|nr:hypothetical protein [Deefgea rivuli]